MKRTTISYIVVSEKGGVVIARPKTIVSLRRFVSRIPSSQKFYVKRCYSKMRVYYDRPNSFWVHEQNRYEPVCL